MEAFAFFGGVPRAAGAGQPAHRGGQARPVRPEDQPVVCGAGRALRGAGRPGPGRASHGTRPGSSGRCPMCGTRSGAAGSSPRWRRCRPRRWHWCREVAGQRACRPLDGAAPAAVFAAVEAEALQPLPAQAVRAGDVVDGEGRPGHPRQGRQDDLLGAVAADRRSSVDARATLDRWCSSSTRDSWSPPTAASRQGQAAPTCRTTRRRRSRSGCGPRPGAGAAPARSARPAPRSSTTLLEVDALFRLRSAQGVLGLADKHGPARLEAACAKAIAAGDPSYRTIKGILAAGAETDPPPPSAGDGGAAAHLHGPSQLFANVIPLPTTTGHDVGTATTSGSHGTGRPRPAPATRPPTGSSTSDGVPRCASGPDWPPPAATPALPAYPLPRPPRRHDPRFIPRPGAATSPRCCSGHGYPPRNHTGARHAAASAQPCSTHLPRARRP